MNNGTGIGYVDRGKLHKVKSERRLLEYLTRIEQDIDETRQDLAFLESLRSAIQAALKKHRENDHDKR